jgi:hypothetical protein
MEDALKITLDKYRGAGQNLMDPHTGDLYYRSGKTTVKLARQNEHPIMIWSKKLSNLHNSISKKKDEYMIAKKNLLLGDTSIDLNNIKNEISESQRELTKFLLVSQTNSIKDEAFNHLRDDLDVIRTDIKTSGVGIKDYNTTYDLLLKKVEESQKNNMMSTTLQKIGMGGILFDIDENYSDDIPISIKQAFEMKEPILKISAKTTSKFKSKAGKKSGNDSKQEERSLEDIKQAAIDFYNSGKKRGGPTVAELKRLLNSKGEPTTGNKPDLLKRISDISTVKKGNTLRSTKSIKVKKPKPKHVAGSGTHLIEFSDVDSETGISEDMITNAKKELLKILKDKRLSNKHPNGLTTTDGKKLPRIRNISLVKTLSPELQTLTSARVLIIHNGIGLLSLPGKTDNIIKRLPIKLNSILKLDVTNLVAETTLIQNNETKTYGANGKIKIGVVLGDTVKLRFMLHEKTDDGPNVVEGSIKDIILNDGDIYIMGEKATGHDIGSDTEHTITHVITF